MPFSMRRQRHNVNKQICRNHTNTEYECVCKVRHIRIINSTIWPIGGSHSYKRYFLTQLGKTNETVSEILLFKGLVNYIIVKNVKVTYRRLTSFLYLLDTARHNDWNLYTFSSADRKHNLFLKFIYFPLRS